MIFASSFSGFGSIATAIILEFKYLTKKERKIIILYILNHIILEKLNFTSWLCLLHSWQVDLCLVVRGDPYTQSQQPMKLKKNRKVKKAEAQSFKKLQITQSYRLCKETNKLRTLFMCKWISIPRKFVRETRGIVLIQFRSKHCSRYQPDFGKFADKTFMLACNSWSSR